MKTFILTLFYFFLSMPLFSQSFQDFDHFQSLFTRDDLAFKLKAYLQKDNALEDYYLLTSEAFYLYASQEDKVQHHPEYTLKLTDSPLPRPYSTLPSSFKGLRVAIDPGHVGGSFAQLEQRWIYMADTRPSEAYENILFKEGTLTLLTALLLKQWLEAEGAIVLLTKEQEGQSVYEHSFFEWLSHQKSLPPLSFPELFRSFYNRLDLQARALKINAFHPDVTLIIHYNAHGDRNPLTQETPPQPYNYHMAFVGGAFCKGELDTQQNRYEFLRLLLTEDIVHSIRLSQLVIHHFTQQLQVPAVSNQLFISYLDKSSIKIDEGVYARNLALTRLVHGPLCYGESLCQDNRQECLKLNAKDLKINGIQGPKRVEQVARAYYEALRAFTRSFFQS